MDKVARIISISDINVKVLLLEENIHIRDVLFFEKEGKKHRFEVVEIHQDTAYTVPFESVHGIKKGILLEKEEEGLAIQYSDEILGKMFNSYGDLIDSKKIKKPNKKNVYERNLTIKEINIKGEELWTGIKVIDFFAPLQKGYKMGLLGGAGVGKTVLIKEIINKV